MTMGPMLQLAGFVLFILVFFGLCIFVHELGHLLVALWRGLYVERFSIGFGKKIWGTTYNNVEYVISMLPFGGYVALPQLEPSDEPEGRHGEQLPHAAPIDRILTALSGPLCNIAFGLFLALFIWNIGIYRPAPADKLQVVSVPEHAPEYKAGLRAGDVIVGIDKKTITHGWVELSELITLSSGVVVLSVERDNKLVNVEYTPAPNPEAEGLGFPFFRVRTPTVVHKIIPGSPAAKSDLRTGDIILEVNGEVVRDPGDFIRIIRHCEGKPLDLTVLRGEQRMTIRALDPEISVDGEASVYRIGAAIDVPMKLVYPDPWEQFVDVFMRTGRTLHSLFAKDSLVKPRHMSGPVGIVQMLWLKLQYGGFREGISFIILVSFSLAFFNLLPIPVLDGGHIVFALIEMVFRRRIPAKFAHAVQTLFALLLIGLMLYITFYDIVRLGRNHEEKQENSQPRTLPEDNKSSLGPGGNGTALPSTGSNEK